MIIPFKHQQIFFYRPKQTQWSYTPKRTATRVATQLNNLHCIINLKTAGESGSSPEMQIPLKSLAPFYGEVYETAGTAL